MAMWRRFDAGEVRDDFAHIAALGLDTVRFFLRWDDFQPQADEIDTTMLDRLETLVALAADHGLRTMPTLCSGFNSGINWLPAWSLDDREPLLGIRNLYSGRLLDAQLLFANAVALRLHQHPGVYAWDIGHAFTNVCEPKRGKRATGGHESEPVAEREVAAWSRQLANVLSRESTLPVTAGTFIYDVTEDRNLRLGTLCAPFVFASMQGSSLYAFFARNRLDPEVVPFLAMIASSFSFKPVLVTGIGNPTCPPFKLSLFERFPSANETHDSVPFDDPLFAEYPCLTEEENAVYCASVLERLHADGRLGAYWWCWSDYGDVISGQPPHERSFGILRSDGTEKPVAAALRTFAQQQREIVPAEDMAMISSSYYYRTLPKSAQTLFEAYLGFIEERRNKPG